MEKISLPVKTKIAAWWMIIFGGIIIVSGLWEVFKEVGHYYPFSLVPLILFFYIPSGLFVFLLPSLLLLRGKRIGWYLAIVMLSIVTALFSLWYATVILTKYFMKDPFFWLETFLIVFISCLPPLIILFFDRKNFWKIAS